MKQFLITTPLEETWLENEPVLFLGEWCRRYDRKHVWEKMDAIVAKPYGVKSEQKERDLDYVRDLSNQILNELVEVLNVFHNVNYSLRFWRIVLGHWLKRYTMVIFNRYFTLVQALENYPIDTTIILNDDSYNLATKDSTHFIWACNDDLWNHVLYARILHYLGGVKLTVIPCNIKNRFQEECNIIKVSKKHILYEVVNFILSKFSKKDDAFIINSYLQRWEEVKLAFLLKQCPQFWQSPLFKAVKFDSIKRLNFRMNLDSHLGFELFIRREIGHMLPICFLEGFEQLMQQVNDLPWPKSPKFIFTSNNFDTDEVFKVWTGRQVECGVPYYVGQHGNNYGTSKEIIPQEAIDISDKFFTWGWNNGVSKNIPTCIFKKTKDASFRSYAVGGLLLIEVMQPHRLETGDSDYNHCIYQQEQFKFVETLPKVIQQELTVRLHSGWRLTPWLDEKRWRDSYPSVHLELGIEKISSLISKNRLVVHSYDSTGILETLASNIPTICFWHGGLSHLLEHAKPFYEMLRKVNIIFDTPIQAAKFITKYWNNIEEWWMGEELQLARKLFCNEYARVEKRKVKILKQKLTEVAKMSEGDAHTKKLDH